MSQSPAPRDFDSLRTAVLEKRSSLPKRLMQVASYALERPDDIAFGTTASIAQAAQVQPSTLVRFAQHFGFEGFSGLQQLFRDRLKGRNGSYEERLRQLEEGGTADTEGISILNGFLAAAHNSLDNLADAVDADRLERAISLLSRANTIYLIARRRSFPIVAYMSYAFGKLKVPCQLVSTAVGNDDDLLSFATSADAAFTVSFAPYAPESIAQANALRAAGVPVIALTDSALSPMVDSAEVWFELVEADHAGFRSLSASFAFAMALTVGVAERRRQG
ncbi:MurR/RpiR family transcriptional regulator [uncultured Devosia sp.]|uniref:MurR/RpiR family transcriptional regulator n=1 Tax=uncultured Devosia sp. TaxID=211434 RepID=UPI0026284F08|nr:MurR/RpiR family transcriptional regulator [uncultured Devosia sp.]